MSVDETKVGIDMIRRYRNGGRRSARGGGCHALAVERFDQHTFTLKNSWGCAHCPSKGRITFWWNDWFNQDELMDFDYIKFTTIPNAISR